MNKGQKHFLILSLILILLSGYLFFLGWQTPFSSSNPDNNVLSESTSLPVEKGNQKEQGRVIRAIDGDTLEIEYQGKATKLRYIGINAPESVDPRRGTQCFGKESAKENQRLTENKLVYLVRDISDTDKFGRLLRYVYLKLDDGQFLFINDYLVREGFATNYTYPPDVSYSEQFKLAEKEARENKRGLWGNCPSVKNK